MDYDTTFTTFVSVHQEPSKPIYLSTSPCTNTDTQVPTVTAIEDKSVTASHASRSARTNDTAHLVTNGDSLKNSTSTYSKPATRPTSTGQVSTASTPSTCESKSRPVYLSDARGLGLAGLLDSVVISSATRLTDAFLNGSPALEELGVLALHKHH
ncbi:hypothetical protein N7517_000480 [Penicillium concentricum]|uniref:Uncharacterized protein n=1 Tax=Penicillium concentricum TaxID=293559 RepID=A0A9W9VIZ6_9EURO|nr:uncharacterized protein N7517_000480 [Penicillium concentricum]KAJ5382569.1 hypothetical protein N7517_000480 [Penicillium concentricum]